jgi:hypothetical protein
MVRTRWLLRVLMHVMKKGGKSITRKGTYMLVRKKTWIDGREMFPRDLGIKIWYLIDRGTV